MSMKRILGKVGFIFSLFLMSFGQSMAEIDIGGSFGPAKNFPDIASLFNILLPNIFIVAGIIVLFLFIFGGLSYIAGGGTGDSQKAEKGKKAVTSAVIGLFLIFGAYFIMKIIEYVTGVNFFNTNVEIPY